MRLGSAQIANFCLLARVSRRKNVIVKKRDETEEKADLGAHELMWL